MGYSEDEEGERGITKDNKPSSVKDATHYLCCRHVIGRNIREYGMKCIVLEKMSRNRLKILVFGERYWKGHDDKKQIRYVYNYRVIPMKKEVKDE